MGGYFNLKSTVFPHLKKQTGSQPNYFLVELLYFLHICKDKERVGAFLNEKEWMKEEGNIFLMVWKHVLVIGWFIIFLMEWK